MYLISDPQPADAVDYFLVEIDGAVIQSNPEVTGDGTLKRVHHELVGLTVGDHVARVKPINAWAEGVWSDPFDFTSQGPPSLVTGLALSEL